VQLERREVQIIRIREKAASVVDGGLALRGPFLRFQDLRALAGFSVCHDALAHLPAEHAGLPRALRE